MYFRSILVVVAVAASLAASSVSAQEVGARKKLGIYFGPSTQQLTVEGLANIHASDWQNFGTGSIEGRIALPLSDGNVDSYQFGLRIGVQYLLSDDLTVSGELAAHFVGMTSFALNAGIDWFFLNSPTWRLGLTPQLGIMFGTMNFGEAKVLPGKTPPVITPLGTFNTGDPLSATMIGFLLGAGLSFEYDFSDAWGLRVSAGFQYGYMGDLTVKAGEVELDMKAPSLVKDDGSTVQAGLDPSGQSLGANAILALMYRR